MRPRRQPGGRRASSLRSARIEERIKDAKLSVSLGRLPLSDLEANRVRLHCSAFALNLLALLSDLIFGPEPPSAHLPRRRQAKFRAPDAASRPRVIRHARRIIVRLPAGVPSAAGFQAAYSAARGSPRHGCQRNPTEDADGAPAAIALHGLNRASALMNAARPPPPPSNDRAAARERRGRFSTLPTTPEQPPSPLWSAIMGKARGCSQC